NALEALEKLRLAQQEQRPFDVLLLDQIMPGLTGKELAERICQDDTLTPVPIIILTSAGVIPLSPEEYQTLGVVRNLSKPIKQIELWRALLEAINPLEPDTPEFVAAVTEAQLDQPALHVLVAEDDRVNQRLIERVLQKLGHQVDLASNGREAVAMF